MDFVSLHVVAWNFNPVFSSISTVASNWAAFKVNGASPTAVSLAAPGLVNLTYAGSIVIGDPWAVIGSSVPAAAIPSYGVGSSTGFVSFP